MYRVDENGKRVEVENMSFGGNGNNSSEIKEGFMDMEEENPNNAHIHYNNDCLLQYACNNNRVEIVKKRFSSYLCFLR